MADVRALLRAERASRHVIHPYATYSPTGQLSCAICRMPVKSDSVWDTHLRSQQHLATLAHAQATTSQGSDVPRKRKADVEVQDDNGERKRSRGVGRSFSPTADLEDNDDIIGPSEQENGNNDDYSPALKLNEVPVGTLHPDADNDSERQNTDEAVNEDEWAAFEKDIGIDEEQGTTLSALTAPASVQAQAVSASELQAQAQDQQQQSARDKRQAELEADREDASRQLEDEFEEMATMEEKLRKLKAQREALRNGQGSASFTRTRPSPAKAVPVRSSDGAFSLHPAEQQSLDREGDEDEDEDEDEDDLASWNFGRPVP